MPEIDLGSVVGPQGKQGETGATGAQGIQGVQGVPGKDATINGYNALTLTAGGAAHLTQDGGTATIAAVGRNLLDNAYFASIDDIIDQRKGYVLVSGATYYSGTDFSDETLLVDTATAYTTVYSVTAGTDYTSFTLTASGTDIYYAAPADVVRGYAGKVYTIDRWKDLSGNSQGIVLVKDGYIRLTSNNYRLAQFVQAFENKKTLVGREVTLSVLCRGTKKTKQITLYDGKTSLAFTFSPESEEKFALYSKTEVIEEENFGNQLMTVRIYPSFTTDADNDWLDIIAIKLELGSTQTLAHQDADGNWVLSDPPPDRALELAKCQRYFYGSLPAYLVHSNEGNNFDTWAIICNFPTTMRTTPVVPKVDIPVNVLGNSGLNAIATPMYAVGANINRLVHAHLTPDNELDKTKIYSCTIRNISAEP